MANPLLIFNSPTSAPGLTVFDVNGTAIGTRPTVNFTAQGNLTVSGFDNSGQNRVDVTVTGSGGGSVLANIVPFPVQSLSDSSWQNFSLVVRVPGGAIMNTANTWQIVCLVTTNTATVGTCVIMRTGLNGTSIIDSTPITFGGVSANFNIPTGIWVGLSTTTSDIISLPIDANHDYYFGFYFTNVSGNSTVSFAEGASNLTVDYIPSAGDKITGQTVTTNWGAVRAFTDLVSAWIRIS